MKNFIALLFCFLTLTISSTTFASEIETNYKIIPFTLNGDNFDNKYSAYLINEKTYVSVQDLEIITGTSDRVTKEFIFLTDTNGIVVIYYPLRIEVEETFGVVEWDENNNSVNLFTNHKHTMPMTAITTTTATTYSEIVNPSVSSIMFQTDGNVPVNIDEKNMYLNISSVAPVVNIYDDEDFTNEVNDILLIHHTNAVNVLENAKKVTTRETFTSLYNIINRYKVISNENSQIIIELNSKTENEFGLIKSDKVEVLIDFANKTVKVVE